MAAEARPWWQATTTPRQALVLALLNAVLATVGWLSVVVSDRSTLSIVLAVGWTLLVVAYGTSAALHKRRLAAG